MSYVDVPAKLARPISVGQLTRSVRRKTAGLIDRDFLEFSLTVTI